MNQKNNIVLAIDPGFDRLGWAVGEVKNRKVTVIGYGCIQTDKKVELFKRYSQIIEDLGLIINSHHPQVLAIEELFFSKNTKTAMKVSEVRGVIIAQMLAANIVVFEYHPNTIKQAIAGDGHADKSAVDKMVRLQLKIGNEKIIDDTIDALAILLTHTVTAQY